MFLDAAVEPGEVRSLEGFHHEIAPGFEHFYRKVERHLIEFYDPRLVIALVPGQLRGCIADNHVDNPECRAGHLHNFWIGEVPDNGFHPVEIGYRVEINPEHAGFCEGPEHLEPAAGR